MDGANLKFNTDVKIELDYNSQKAQGFDYESWSSKSNIKYEVSLETREWGIKSILFLASPQELTFDVELLEKDLDDVDPIKVSFKVNVSKIEVDVNNVDLNKGDISPSELNLLLTNVRKVNKYNYEADATGTLVFG